MKETTGERLFDKLGMEKRADAPEPMPLQKPDVDAGEVAKAVLVRLAVPAVVGALWVLSAMAETGLDLVEVLPPIATCVLLVAAWWIAHWFFPAGARPTRATIAQMLSSLDAVRCFGTCSRSCSASLRL